MTRTPLFSVLLAGMLVSVFLVGCSVVDPSLYMALPLDAAVDAGPVDAADDGGDTFDGGPLDAGPMDAGRSCAVDHGGCDALVTCVEGGSGPVCGACPDGYRGTGETACADIDECADDTDGCDPLVSCSNTVGSFTCGVCPLGYDGEGATGCTDIDECAADIDGCDPLATCANTPGGYTCGSCPVGYMGGGDSGCVDIDECASGGPCGAVAGATCSNTPGTYACVCPAGYTAPAAGGTCADIDECATGGACDTAPAASCANTEGSFVCACPADYSGTGRGASGCLYDVATLASLTVGTGATLSPAFAPGTTTYALTLASGALSTPLTPTVAEPARATITVAGSTVASGAMTPAPAVVAFAPVVVDILVTTESGAARTYTVVISRWPVYAKASNTGSYEAFGSSVSLSQDGTRLAVGAPGEDSNATGIGGDQLNNAAGAAGAVYVFARSSTTWTQEAYIKASNTDAGDLFGASVSLSADGARLAVGARLEDSSAMGIDGVQASNAATDSGAVYVFARAGSAWTQEAYIKASNTEAGDEFGGAVALSADGTLLAVGARGEDARTTGINGDGTDNTSSGSGAAYVFTRGASTTWTQEAYIKASAADTSDDFGGNVALSADGTRLAVSARLEDSTATGVNGAYADNGAVNSGAAYVFARTAGTWAQEAYVKASNTGSTDYFGSSLALSSDGLRLAVGAPDEDSPAEGVGGSQGDGGASGESGSVYVFARTGTTWTQEAYLKASHNGSRDQFGWTLSLSADGGRLAASARGESSRARGIGGNQLDDSAGASGAVYVFLRAGVAWAQEAYVKASNTDTTDSFCSSIALSGDGTRLAVGATGEASTARGINGDQTINTATQSGATYIY